jgi:hypothetical protein
MAYTPGELLLRGGIVKAPDLRRALELQEQTGAPLGECLVRLGVIDEAALATFYHKRLVLPMLDEDKLQKIPREVLSLVPKEVAVEFRLLPVMIDRDGALLVAMADPSDNHAVEELGFFVNRFVVRAVARMSAIRRAIEKHHGVKLDDIVSRSSVTKPERAAPVAAKAAPKTEPKPTPKAASHTHRESFIAPGPLFPRNVEQPYDPLRKAPAVNEPTEEVVLLTKKKRRDTPIMARGAPPPDEPAPTEEPLLLTQRRRERTGTLPGIHSADAPKPPIEALRNARQRDEVARHLLDYASSVLGHAVLFVVRQGDLVGFDARGGDLDRASVEMLKVPLNADSLFREVVDSRLAYRGPLPDGPRNRTLARALGAPAAAEVLVLPILVRGRVVALLFGDRITELLPEVALQALCYEAGLAYERILVRRAQPK